MENVMFEKIQSLLSMLKAGAVKVEVLS